MLISACATIWAQDSTDALDETLQNIALRLSVYQKSLTAKLDTDIKALADLRLQLANADTAAIKSLGEKAEQAPSFDLSKLGSGGTAANDFIEKQLITSDFTDARDLANKVNAKRHEIHQALALLSALNGVIVAVKECGRDHRAYLTAHPPESGARLANGPRFANGIDPTKPDRTQLFGTVTGVYSFTTCKGTGSSWTPKQGFVITVDSNYAIDGKVVFQGRTVPVYGSVLHNDQFRALGTLAVPGGQPFRILLAGSLKKGGLGSPVLTAGTIAAGDRATGACKGILL